MAQTRPSQLTLFCGRIRGSCNPDMQRCCGANDYYPVYINPELTGCYTPRIPGYGVVAPGTNTLTGFTCGDVPAALIGGPKVIAPASYSTYPRLVPVAQLPIHPLSVLSTSAQIVFSEFGCFNPTPPLVPLFTGIGLPTPILTSYTLENCAEACNVRGYTMFAMNNGK